MFDQIYEYFTPQYAVAILVAVSVFATIFTLAAPLMDGDKLRGRMKNVASERQRLREQQSVALTAAARPGKHLRDKPKGTIAELVETLNLRSIFEAETSRIALRQAGLRSEKHLVTFLAAKAISPIFFAILVFVYSSTVFADTIPSSMRLTATMVGVIFGFYLPNIYLKNRVTNRQKSIKRSWSDALDLLLICVESGMAIEPAMKRVSMEIGAQSVPLAEEMTLTTAELSYLGDRTKAFENLGKRVGLPMVKSVVISMIQAERYGTPLGQALRVLAQENRDLRMLEAEKIAAALPPKLTVPMILFFLPVIFVVILGPAIIMVYALPPS